MESNSEFLWKQDYFKRFANVYSQKVLPLTVFTGAGSSRTAGLPSWDELVEKLISQLISLRKGVFGDAFLEREIQEINSQSSNWDKIELLSRYLDSQYVYAVRAILKNESVSAPDALASLWKLSPSTFLTLNLDGLASQAYANLRTGVPLRTDCGFTIGGRMDTFSAGHNKLVELHGNIDEPTNWVLTQSDLEKLLQNRRYISYIRSILSQSLVLFYGVGIDDVSVGGHLKYLREIELNGGEFFILCKRSDSIINKIHDIPVQPIFLEGHDWEKGLKIFTDTLINFVPKDPSFRNPVLPTNSAAISNFPSPGELIKLSPNEIRMSLNNLSESNFSDDNNNFDFEKFSRFCREYDSPIFLATRVNPDSDNNFWLDYHVEQEIGKGNFGRVYSASSTSGDRIAIKIAHPEVRDHERMLASFRRGVRSMRIISADNISGTVRLVDASELPPSIVMEYIDGVNLEEYIYQFPEEKIYNRFLLINRISSIVQNCHLHSMIILHRDLRPANIMIGGEYWDSVDLNKVHVLDFDLSWYKGATGSEYYMNSAQDLGYLAPEQLDIKSRYSTRNALVDVYGIGMLLYFTLQREHPFANASRTSEWDEKCIAAGRKAYSAHIKSCSWRTSRLIWRATAFEQDKRPMLNQLIDELGILAEILDGSFPIDDTVVFEEICYRLGGQNFHNSLSFSGNVYKTNLAGGAQATISILGRKIRFEFLHTTGETVDRRKRGRLLQSAYDRASEIAAAIGDVDERRSGIGHGTVSIVFSCDVPSSFLTLNKTTERISDIISSININ